MSHCKRSCVEGLLPPGTTLKDFWIDPKTLDFEPFKDVLIRILKPFNLSSRYASGRKFKAGDTTLAHRTPAGDWAIGITLLGDDIRLGEHFEVVT